MSKFDLLSWKSLLKTEVVEGGEELHLYFEGGLKLTFYHRQDCCENVSIEDICGDLGDMCDTKLLSIEERHSNDGPKGEFDESFTWTFYTFRTLKGTVDVRWYGTSNGYYSERVDAELGTWTRLN